METSVLVIGAIIIAICAVPMYILSRGSKKEKQAMLAHLQQMAAAVNCHISESEFCGDFVIGVDSANKYVFYYRKTKDDVAEQTINLKQYNHCKVATSYQASGQQAASARYIDRVDLNFLSANGANKETRLPFYNSMVNIQLSTELVLAEAWAKKTQQLIVAKA